MRGLLVTAVLALSACAGGGTDPSVAYAPAIAAPPAAPAGHGAIFNVASGYAGLAEGNRAHRVGDLVTVVLVERANVNSNAQTRTQRDGTTSISAPGLGEVGRVLTDGLNLGSGSSFKGQGSASQAFALNGEIAVTIAELRPGGVVLLRGEKRLGTVQGRDTIRLSGLARLSDISADNRIASVQLADARIDYGGTGSVARSGRPGWLSRFFAAVSPF